MASIPVKPLGFKSGEGYDAVQGADGRRYYMVGGMLLDPQTGAQVGNAAPANTMTGGAPGGAMGMTPGTQGAGYWRDPGTSVNAIQPYIDAVRAGGQGPGGLEPGRVQGGPYLQYQPPQGYPQMPGYPGGYGPGNVAPEYRDYFEGRGYGGVAGRQPGYYPGEGNLRQQGGPAMRYGQPAPQPQQRAAVQPYQRPTVPLAHQVNPMVWDSLGPVGRELAYGAIGQTGQDPGQYEYDLNQARPRGSSLGGAGVRYASSRGFGGF